MRDYYAHRTSIITGYSLISALYRDPDINPFKPDFTIVIFIHYKPRIAVAILGL